MNKIALRIEGLGKRYSRGRLEAYQTLRDTIVNLFRPSKDSSEHGDEFWALRDFSLELSSGEVLGIVGRNGAGKSTLLKLLSRITHPDEGRIELFGRVGALLEVGTGFHPELTGRENIFMNGILLGMKRSEVQRRFDEIVEFSGVEDFLDTPVKRYSSGMRVRLGFSVAAHLEPEVLIVDEVLAVGDAQFQAKCLGRMNDVARAGRTVIFVSHQLESILTLCSRSIWLDEGRLRLDGSPSDVVSEYLSHTRSVVATQEVKARKDRRGEGAIRVVSISLEGRDDAAASMISVGSPTEFQIRFVSDQVYKKADLKVKLAIRDQLGRIVARLANDYVGTVFEDVPKCGTLAIRLPRVPLTPGSYYVDFIVRLNGVVMDQIREAFSFEITPGDYFGLGRVSNSTEAVVFVDQTWELRPE